MKQERLVVFVVSGEGCGVVVTTKKTEAAYARPVCLQLCTLMGFKVIMTMTLA